MFSCSSSEGMRIRASCSTSRVEKVRRLRRNQGRNQRQAAVSEGPGGSPRWIQDPGRREWKDSVRREFGPTVDLGDTFPEEPRLHEREVPDRKKGKLREGFQRHCLGAGREIQRSSEWPSVTHEKKYVCCF